VILVEAGRRQLMRVKPGGVALKSSAEVAEGVIQVSVRAKRWLLRDWAKSDVAVYFRGLRGEQMLSVQTLKVVEQVQG